MSNLNHTFYFDVNGNSEQRLRYLNCYERVIYFYYKNKCFIEYDILNLFICNYLPMIKISNSKIVDFIGCPLYKTDQNNIQLSHISESLSDMTDLIKKGEYVVFQTSDPDIPFSNIYKKYNLDDGEYGDYYLAIACTDDYLYLPLFLYNDFERLYHYNENISYIHWDDMKEAFNKQLKIYRFVHTGNTEKPVDDIHHELFSSLIQFYRLSEKESDYMIYYGIACIETLLNLSTNESLHLDDIISGKLLYLKLKACVLSTIGKRQVLKECLEKTYRFKYDNLILKIAETINAYITFISVLEIENIKKSMVFGNRYQKSLEHILLTEIEMNKALCDYIQEE